MFSLVLNKVRERCVVQSIITSPLETLNEGNKNEITLTASFLAMA